MRNADWSLAFSKAAPVARVAGACFVAVLFFTIAAEAQNIRLGSAERVFQFDLPDFPSNDPNSISKCEHIGETFDDAINSCFDALEDETLSTTTRIHALEVLSQFSGQNVANRLLDSIEFHYTRGFISRANLFTEGLHPVVTLASYYGEPVARDAVRRLTTEENPYRRDLLFEVLDKGVGYEWAIRHSKDAISRCHRDEYSGRVVIVRFETLLQELELRVSQRSED